MSYPHEYMTGGKGPSGFGHLGLLSLIASLLGSSLAAAIYVAMQYTQGHLDIETVGAAQSLLFVSVVFVFGALIVAPIGMAVGIPLMALSRHYIPAHIVVATPTFAILGLLGGLAIKQSAGSSGLDNAELVFGACVGGMHAVVYGRANGVLWYKVATAFLLAVAAVPSLAYVGEDAGNLMQSKAEFETRCADHYGSMAVVADREVVERFGNPADNRGKWHNQLKWRSLYDREDSVPLDNAHVLIARDYAYVPSGVAGWISGGRRVERHCLSEKKGRDADMLRSRGLGKRPELRDLRD